MKAFIYKSAALLFSFLIIALSAGADPLDTWHYRNPIPTAEPLSGITYGAGKFVAVGGSGASTFGGIIVISSIIVTSSNAVDWIAVTSPQSLYPIDVAYGNGLFVAVGYYGSVISSNGINWSVGQIIAPYYMLSVTYGNGRFVAVGNRGIIRSSTDGKNWDTISLPTPLSLNRITYAQNRFVAVGESGSIFTSENGVDWTQVAGTSGSLSDVSYLNGRFLASGYGSQILASQDGLTWTALPNSPCARFVTYGNGIYLAGGCEYNKVFASFDAINWFDMPLGNQDWVMNRAIFQGGTFVGIGSPAMILTSTGLIWTNRVHAISSRLADVEYGSGQFVSVGDLGSILTSPDGVAWTAQPTVVRTNLSAITYGGGAFVAVGDGGTILRSANGLVWSVAQQGIEVPLKSIAYGNGRFIAASSQGATFTSSDGSTWIPGSVGFGIVSVNSITWGNGTFLVVGEDGTVATSEDGLMWSVRRIGLPLKSVVYGNSKFVAVGYYEIVSSLDGIAWQLESTLPVYNHFAFPQGPRIIYGNGQFVVTTGNGSILTSTHESDWYYRNSPIYLYQGIYGLAYGNGTFVMVGDSGIVYQSGPDGTSTLPAVVQQPVNQTAMIGGTITFTAAASGAFPISFQWQRNGTNLVGATNTVLTITNIQPADAGLYSVVIHNSFGTATSDSAELAVASSSLRIQLFAGLTIEGFSGRTYRIEFAPNLVQTNVWSPLITLVLPTSPYLWVDTQVPATSNRFYRAVLLP